MRRRVDPPFEIPDADPRFAFAGHKSIDVEREALVDLTYCYAQERPPEKAVDYLEAHASTREAYVAALHKMALRFATLEQPKGAADVTRELLRLGSDDDERLDDARLLHNVVTRMNDYSQVGEDVDLILRAMRRRLLRPDLDEAGQKQLVREFEMVARDLATRSQKVLSGVDLAEKADPAAEPTPPKTGKPEKNRSLASKGKEWNQIPATPQESARAYEAYLRAIPESPYRLEMVTNLADVLVDAGNFLEAGNRYREAAAILGKKVADGQAAGPKDEAKLQAPDDPPDEKKTTTDPDADQSTDKPAKASDKKEDEGEAPEISKLSKGEKAQRRADALYDAVVAYQKSLGSKQSDSHEVRATARAGLRQAGAQYLAEGNPDKGRELRIKFAIAETYYNEGKHMQAVDLLTAVALEFPGTQQGDAAVQLVLDSYNTRNDISGLIAAGQLFANAPQLSEAVRASVQPILAAAEQRRLDDLSLAAAGDQAGGMESLLAFAEVYKGSDLGEKALLNTFVAARAAGDTQKIYAVGDQILKDFPGVEGSGRRRGDARADGRVALRVRSRARLPADGGADEPRAGAVALHQGGRDPGAARGQAGSAQELPRGAAPRARRIAAVHGRRAHRGPARELRDASGDHQGARALQGGSRSGDREPARPRVPPERPNGRGGGGAAARRRGRGRIDARGSRTGQLRARRSDAHDARAVPAVRGSRGDGGSHRSHRHHRAGIHDGCATGGLPRTRRRRSHGSALRRRPARGRSAVSSCRRISTRSRGRR